MTESLVTVLIVYILVFFHPGGADLCLGGSLSRGVSVRKPPHTAKSGRYASYWNAFLFFFFFVSFWWGWLPPFGVKISATGLRK